MQKGLFWVVPDSCGGRKLIAYSAICDSNGVVAAEQPEYNSKKGNSYSHERTWQEAATAFPSIIRNKPWNFYPRGRVEIANGNATVYYNPEISEWSEFHDAIMSEFELGDISVRFTPDYSKHYKPPVKLEKSFD